MLLSSEDFLSYFPNHTIAYSKLDKWGKYIDRNRNATFDDALVKNSVKNQYDIFFTPNWDLLLAAWGQRWVKPKEKLGKDSARNVYCLFVEIDGPEKSWNLLWEANAPTFIVKTKKWYHVYWMLLNPVSYTGHHHLFDDAEEALCDIFWWDYKAKDIARLLRIPWFTYWKGTEGTIQAEVVSMTTNRFDFNTIVRDIKKIHQEMCHDIMEEKTLVKKHREFKWELRQFFDSVSRVDVREVLSKLSWWRYQHHSGPLIKEEWRVTNGYKYNEQWNYINNFAMESDRPIWGPFSIAKYYLKINQEIFAFFKNEYKIAIDSEVFYKQIEIKREHSIIDTYRGSKIERIWDDFKWIEIDPVKNLTYYYYENNQEIMFKWVVKPIWFINLPWWDKEVIAHITDAIWWKKIVVWKAMGSENELRKFMQKKWIALSPSPSFAMGIFLDYLVSVSDEYAYTEKLWLQYINWKRIMISKWWVYVDEVNKVLVNAEDASWITIVEWDNGKSVQQYVAQLLLWYKWHTAYLAFLCACLWVNVFFFRELQIPVPMFFVLWLSWVGKTEMMTCIMRSLWYRYSMAATSKVFVYKSTARHYMPIYCSDYRDGDIKDKEGMYSILRHIFDNQPIIQWTSSQKTIKYETNAQLLFCWQTLYTDDACLTRTVITTAKTFNKWEYDAIKNLPLINSYIVNMFRDSIDFKEFIFESKMAAKELQDKLKNTWKRSDDRIAQNFWFLLAVSRRMGLQKYEDLIESWINEYASMIWSNDISVVYQKVFNLQIVNWFDCYLYKWWMVIVVIEEGIRYNAWLKDLEWFIKTVNNHFLWVSDLTWLNCYIDFEYVFANRSLWWSFSRAISRSRWLRASLESEEEQRSYLALQQFISKHFPDHDKISEMNMDLNIINTKKKSVDIE